MVSKTRKSRTLNLVKDITGFERIGDKLGSNPGGIYQSPSGAKYMLKIMDDEHIFNELLTSKLYKLAGIPVVDLYVGRISGANVLLGKWIDDLARVDFRVRRHGKAAYIYGAGADIWLANWDVIGPGRDNIMIAPNGQLIRTDVGGSMFMRAQAARGKKKFNNLNVPELRTFKDPEVSKIISQALSPYTEEELRQSLQRIIGLSDSDIKSTVMDVWRSADLDISKSLAEEYIRVLIRRKHLISDLISG